MFRPDISLVSGGELLATIEVVDTNLSERALNAETKVAQAYYFHVDGRCWCSPECWQWQHGRGPGSGGHSPEWRRASDPLPRVSTLPRCEICDRWFMATAYPNIRLYDWADSTQEERCLECAVQYLDGAQYKDPGECIDGNTIPSGSDDVRGNVLALADAVFWAMVWRERTAKPNSARYDESATTQRLDEIEAAFTAGEWEHGAQLLAPIGAPAWSMERDEESPLYAWDPNNCRRTAEAWKELRTWRVKQLPEDLQPLVRAYQPVVVGARS